MDTFLRSTGRYISGRPMDGNPRTDSTFLRRGTKPLTRTGHASPWSYLPGWKRAAWRVVPPVVLASGTVSYFTHPVATTVTGSTLLAAGVAETGRRVHRRIVNRRHTRDYLVPLHRTLARVLGDAGHRPQAWLQVPPDFARDGVESTIQLPRDLHMTRELRAAITDVVRQRLGFDPDFSWHTIGPRPMLAFRPAPEPPDRLSWAAMADHARKAPDSQPVLGMGPRCVVVDVDLEADSPHILVSSGSGGGKSILVKTLVAQALNRGAGAVFLDYKRHSHRWADGLPGVVYAKDVEDIHETLVALGVEGERRNRLSDDTGTFDGPQLWVVCEEMNATMLKLQAYWQATRDKGDPVRSPAVAALADLVFMGRAVRIHVVAVAQQMTARTLGGGEVRENFAVRCLTRCTKNTLKMLAPEILPVARMPKGAGRWLIVRNGESTLTQVVMMTDDEARDWSMAGRPNPTYVLTSQEIGDQAKSPRTVSALLPVAEMPEESLTGLRDALSRLPGAPMTLDAIRKAAQRRSTTRFPEPVGQDGPEALYRLDELVSWKRARDARRVVAGTVA